MRGAIPSQPRAIEKKGHGIQNVASDDALLLVNQKELPTESAVEKNQFGVGGNSGRAASSKADQLISLFGDAGYAELPGNGQRQQSHVGSCVNQHRNTGFCFSATGVPYRNVGHWGGWFKCV